MEWTGFQIFRRPENFGAGWICGMRKRKKLLPGCCGPNIWMGGGACGQEGEEQAWREGLHEVKGLGKFLVAGEWPHGTIKKVVAWL